jgi:hypothetical protein
VLSKNQVVKARKAIESMYDGTCTITEYQEYTKENKSTGHHEVVVLEGQPCRLSFSSFPNTNQTDTAAQLVQTIKIFLAPEIRVQAGSKLTVTQNGVTTEYKSSGEPALYQTHQEIMLELFKGWA